MRRYKRRLEPETLLGGNLPFETSSGLGETNVLSDKLSHQLDLIGDALDASQDGFAIWEAIRNSGNSVIDFTLVFMNKAGAEQTGRTLPQILGKRLEVVVGDVAAPGLLALFAKALEDRQTVKEIIPVHSPEGWASEYENTVVPVSSDQVLSTYRDVSEERKEHGRLVWLTEHDYLTGMPNRAKLLAELGDAISSASDEGSMFAFVFIDIDFFKKVNDTYGHDVGDELLVNFIKRIHHSLPEESLVARISGDEFAILLRNVTSEIRLRELMDEVFSAMKRPFTHKDFTLEITCSAGCVLSDGSEVSEEIIRIADKAMYRAKHQGRNRYLVETRSITT
jgi:diguanylate cyclase (GGDEF)-like protein